MEACRDDGLVYGQNSCVHRLQIRWVTWTRRIPCLQVSHHFHWGPQKSKGGCLRGQVDADWTSYRPRTVAKGVKETRTSVMEVKWPDGKNELITGKLISISELVPQYLERCVTNYLPATGRSGRWGLGLSISSGMFCYLWLSTPWTRATFTVTETKINRCDYITAKSSL